MAQVNYRMRTAELESAIVESFVELDKADGSRIGLQEAIDSAQSILREAYGDSLDEDAEEYREENSEEND
ncbi:MAG: hypothetical protein K1X72_16875 [Pyrinomonadaceae bacterium]|nr:hypothetical protein [Pyrinomonadaceae bacterium]